MNSVRECSAFIADYPGPVKSYEGLVAIERCAAKKVEGLVDMGSRNTFALVALLLALSAHGLLAQQSTDSDGVKAQTPYVTYVGPRSTAIIVGWEDQRKYWSEFNKPFSQRTVALVDAHIRVVSNLA